MNSFKCFVCVIHVIVLLELGGSATVVSNYPRQNDLLLNQNPIIGLLAQEQSYHLEGKYPGMYKSFIAASYVKFIESGGARVVPIWIDKDREYYADIMGKVNGVLFPGGATYFNQSDGYADAGRHIYDIAVEMNNRNDYMPIWGTCLGFELLTYLSANSTEHRAHCSSQNQALPLDFKPDFKTSNLFKNAPSDVIDILATEPVTSNFHQFCVTEKNLTDYNIESEWKVMSVNDDWNGMTFISTIEHTKYPFYGIQFHPEKNMFEWVQNKNISHSLNAIKVSQYFSNFFISEAQKNHHKFENATVEDNYVIYNYPTTFTGLVKSAYEQCYFFTDTVEYMTATTTTSTATDGRSKASSVQGGIYSSFLVSILLTVMCMLSITN